ncbi:ComF family protein [Nitrosomonas marina]|nr:ComF family protein [Nitrosomonas marina]
MKLLIHKNCILCGAVSSHDFCSGCSKSLSRLTANVCKICAKTLITGTTNICGSCLASPPAYSTTIAALIYTFPADMLVHALKYRQQLAIAPVLAELLLETIRHQQSTDQPDLVIPMPLHPKRLQERGFNQAIEIGRHLSQQLRIQFCHDSCKRIKNTLPQAELPWKMRRDNVKKAFICNQNLSGMHVAIVDDVMTTGATLNELANQLRKQGACRITNWIVTRAQKERFWMQSDYCF